MPSVTLKWAREHGSASIKNGEGGRQGQTEKGRKVEVIRRLQKKRKIIKKKIKKNLAKQIYALPSLYYLINSVISKTILFMSHLPHQKCKKGKKEEKETFSTH